MSEGKKHNLIDEQRKRQQELVELKLRKQEFEENPDSLVPEATVPLPISRKDKIRNFLYYGKTAIIGITIVAIILAVGITQCATRTKYDMTIVVYFKQYLTSAMIENIGTVAERYCEDTNGDGEVHVLVMDCAIPDEERMLETGQGKATRLMGQFANEQAIVYIVDRACLDDLDTVANGVFVDDSLGLPEENGKAYKLNGTEFDDAFNSVSENYTGNFEYFLMRRVVGGTDIDDHKNVKQYSEQANRFILAVMNDPRPGKAAS